MKIETSRFGTINVDEDKIIFMPKGIIGFPERKRYVMLRHREGSPFYWYQSIDDGGLAFVIMSPFIIIPDYQYNLEYILNEMNWDRALTEKDIELYVIVTIPRGEPEKMTANLMAPLVINTKIREAGQIVLPDTPYHHRYPVIEQGKKSDKETSIGSSK